MRTWRAIFLCLLFAVGTMVSAAFPQEINLQPKYGLLPKNEAQKTADAAFLAGIDSRFGQQLDRVQTSWQAHPQEHAAIGRIPSDAGLCIAGCHRHFTR